MHEPSGGGRPGAGSNRRPPTVSRSRSPKLHISSTPTVWPVDDPRRRADPAGEVEAASSRCRRRPCPRRPPRPRSRARRSTSVDRHGPRVAHVAVVALPDDGDHRLVGSPPGGEDGGLVDGADGVRAAQLHGRLDDPPLVDLELLRSAPRRRSTVSTPARAGSRGGTTTVTPVASPLAACAWPTRTPGTSVIALRAPGREEADRPRDVAPAASRQDAGRAVIGRRRRARAGAARDRCCGSVSSRDRATGMEPAPGRDGHGVRRLAGEDLRVRASRAGRAWARPRSAPSCRGAAGCGRRPFAGPSSTIRPRYITAIRSAKWAAVDRSCVIITIARPSRRSSSSSAGCRRARRRRASTPARRPQQLRLAAPSRAAIATRWRWPPESSCGYRSR